MRRFLPSYSELDRRAVNVITGILLSSSIVVAILWLSFGHSWSDRFEPMVELFGFSAGFLGLFLDRRIEAAERRTQALTVLEIELRDCRALLLGPRFSESENRRAPRTYPAVRVTAVNAAILSGTFGGPRDAQLVAEISAWYSAANELNHATRLTEMITFIKPELAESFARALHKNDSVLADARQSCDRLLSTLETLGAGTSQPR